MTVTYDGLDAKIYLNGDIKDNVNCPGSITTTNMPLLVGAEPSPTGSHADFYDGIIDEVRIYSRSLSDVEILRIYEQ